MGCNVCVVCVMWHVYVLVHMLRQENANLRTTNELLRRSHETARRYGCIGWMDMQDGRYTTTSVRYIYVTTPVDLSGAAREPSATSQAGGAGGRVQLGRRGQSVASPGGQEEAGRRAHVEASRNKKKCSNWVAAFGYAGYRFAQVSSAIHDVFVNHPRNS